jgi:hypothetical protein
MVYFNERLVSAPHYSLFNRLSDTLLMTVCKKAYQDRLAYVKRWEREKIVNLGLTETIVSQPPVDNKNFRCSAWEKEKVSQFGLIGAGSHRSLYREDPYYQQEQRENNLLRKTLGVGKQFVALLAEQIIAAREENVEDDAFTAEQQPPQVLELPAKNRVNNKFLQDLGYE